MDLFPTICEACGAEFDHLIEGRSFLPTLLGESQRDEDRYLFWVRREGGARYGGRAYYAARYGPWKLVQNSPYERLVLYNLDEDPREEQPIKRNHEMYKQLFEALQRHISESGLVPWQRVR
jgi:arylsulfatase A-like enzyme